MTKSIRSASAFGVLAVSAVWSVAVAAQTPEAPFTPFNAFIQQVAAARFEAVAAASTARVADANEFERMRAHVLTLYKGVTVTHSFVDDGQTFDCVPIARQPSLQGAGPTSIAAPPPSPPGSLDDAAARSPDGGAILEADQTDGASRLDPFGNATTCESGAFPMRRVTLAEITRFHTLRQFFQKNPGDAGGLDKSGGEAAAIPHHYAHAYQFVTNYGGASELNLWSPRIDAAKGELMSLSQHWYVNYRGSLVQTAEGGWQNMPLKWGVNRSVLFIYWTADGYNKTGCYNTDCKGFVQTNSKVALGKGFAHYSTYGGAQYEFKLTYRLYKGAWWLEINNAWVGYYPARLYGVGKLRYRAAEVDYGGETVGNPIYPPMGSGRFASLGYRRAAYQRLIRYTSNGLTGASFAARLTGSQATPNCYTIRVHNKSGAWGSYFYFGGPGGGSC